MLPKDRLKRHRLKLVIVGRTRPVCIHVINLRLLHPALRDRHLHRGRQSPSLRRRRSNVMRIACRPVSHNLAVNLRPSCQGAVERFEDDDSRALAHDEAGSVGVEGTGSRGGVVVVLGRHGLHAGETGVGEGGDGGFGAAGDHLVSVSVGDHAEGFADGVGGGGASRCDAVVGALAAAFDADNSGGCVTKEGGDAKGRYLRSGLLELNSMLDW
mmetsp:Transcript_933/g.1725  ORF Transcript_933/g.1725 Transcript_933/m.1725 type:complete len:213 (+) Transcript_933:425-1063(+)